MIIVVITTDLAVRIKRNVTLVRLSIYVFLDHVSSHMYNIHMFLLTVGTIFHLDMSTNLTLIIFYVSVHHVINYIMSCSL